MYRSGVQSRPASTSSLNDKIIYSTGYCKEHQGVESPCLSKMTVEQGMESPLAAASRTIIAREQLEGAFEREPEVGIVSIIIPTKAYKGNGCDSHCQCRSVKACLHQPMIALTIIMGIIPRANEIITSHAAHSEAFLALSRFPWP